MKITIDTDVVEKYGFTLPEFLRLYSMRENKGDDLSPLMQLSLKGLVSKSIFGEHFTFKTGTADMIDRIVSVSATGKETFDFDYDSVYDKILEFYPKGSQPNTKKPWRISRKRFHDRMESLFQKVGRSYEEDRVVAAFRHYVDEHQPGMRTMGYFIWTTDRDGIFDSELASLLDGGWIENNTATPPANIIQA